MPLRILNPFNETKIIYPDTVVGTVDEILGVLNRVEPVGNPTEIRGSSCKPHGKDNPMADVVPKYLESLMKLPLSCFVQLKRKFSWNFWHKMKIPSRKTNVIYYKDTDLL